MMGGIIASKLLCFLVSWFCNMYAIFQLIKLLTTHKVEEKDLFGIKVSTRALEKLTPQEIKDLRVVFESFDTQERG